VLDNALNRVVDKPKRISDTLDMENVNKDAADFQVIYRVATGCKWHVIGAPKTKEDADRKAKQLVPFLPSKCWVTIKPVWAKFPDIA
jgi:hypothetical protein